ncbi:MAG: hypothetical protein NTU53_14405 [Planctomycetota bacterium]|nr:hypothetical protein [Planctomycetota bacterium]
MRSASTSWGAVLALVVCGVAPVVCGDPLPGQVLKFDQQPMVATPSGGSTYFGHDELSTAYLQDPARGSYVGPFMADDFADKFSSPVVHVTWWGSYLQPTTAAGVSKFLIAFEDDVPVNPFNNFSRPGQVLLPQVVNKGPLAPGSGTFTETPVRGPDPVLGEALYQYNAELALPFAQKPDTVYWLKIVALVDPQIENQIAWGWHNRDYTLLDPLASPAVTPGERIQGFLSSGEPIWHFQDDAVTGHVFPRILPSGQVGPMDQSDYAPTRYLQDIDGPFTIADASKDLAFQLYTVVPGPSSLILLTAPLLLLARSRRQWEADPVFDPGDGLLNVYQRAGMVPTRQPNQVLGQRSFRTLIRCQVDEGLAARIGPLNQPTLRQPILNRRLDDLRRNAQHRMGLLGQFFTGIGSVAVLCQFLKDIFHPCPCPQIGLLANAQLLGNLLGGVGWGGAKHNGSELPAVFPVDHPPTLGIYELSRLHLWQRTKNGYEVFVAPHFHLQDRDAAFGIMERHPLDQAVEMLKALGSG